VPDGNPAPHAVQFLLPVTGSGVHTVRILLAIDESACSVAATKAVIAQFRPQHAEVQVLHVDEWPKGLPPSMAFAEGPAVAKSILSQHELRRHNASALVTRAAQHLQAAGFTTTSSLREGDARQAILDCASEWHADLIVLGSHGKKGFDRLVLGSVSDSIARHAPCSVEIVREPSTRA
jgi:nucleotide-binding universal stress UspA family protein